MNRLLAINTASTPCSVALCLDGKCHVRQSKVERQAAQQVLPLIQELLDASGVFLSGLDAVAVVTGPGSFTGMRIGVGVAQGLALANELPVIPLSALAVIAKEAAMQDPASENWLVAMPARPPDIYLGAYRCAPGEELTALHKEWIGEPQRLAAEVATLGIREWGAAGAAWRETERLGELLGVELLTCQSELVGAIDAVCELARECWREERYVPAEQALPNYIKEEMDYS